VGISGKLLVISTLLVNLLVRDRWVGYNVLAAALVELVTNFYSESTCLLLRTYNSMSP